jgi:F-type H+-transporting ATPase subunit epsilon
MLLNVVTPEGLYFEGEVSSLVLPAHDGLLGIWKDHAPMVNELGKGEVLARLSDGSEKKFFLSGGYLQVLNNNISVLALEVSENSTS